MAGERTLIAENVAVLLQGVEQIDALAPEIYARVGRFDARSAIGTHFRHCIEFYSAFLEGVRTAKVDYGARARDPRLERNSAVARERMAEIARALDTLDAAKLERAAEVRADGEACDVWSPSSLGRELQFLASHTVHHFALIGLLLRLEGVEPAEEFGVAPSTLAHWRSQACAR